MPRKRTLSRPEHSNRSQAHFPSSTLLNNDSSSPAYRQNFIPANDQQDTPPAYHFSQQRNTPSRLLLSYSRRHLFTLPPPSQSCRHPAVITTNSTQHPQLNATPLPQLTFPTSQQQSQSPPPAPQPPQRVHIHSQLSGHHTLQIRG